MYCLFCGDCCLRMSPLYYPNPCLRVINIDNFYFCSDYYKRPQQCSNHDFPARFCPVGMSKLGISETTNLENRVIKGLSLIKERKITDDGWI